jgi:hypothetical protein
LAYGAAVTGVDELHEVEVELAVLGGRLADLRALSSVLDEELTRRGLDRDAAREWSVLVDDLLAEPAAAWSDLDVVAGARTVGWLLESLHGRAVELAELRDRLRAERVELDTRFAETLGVVAGPARWLSNAASRRTRRRRRR